MQIDVRFTPAPRSHFVRVWILTLWGTIAAWGLAASDCWAANSAAKATPPSPDLDTRRSATPGHLDPSSLSFLRQNCLDCHDRDFAEGDFDVNELSTDISSEANLERWVRVLDRIELGEMPPEDAEPLPARQRDNFLRSTADRLAAYQRQSHQAEGRVQARRLTLSQLERTLHDLLVIDLPLARLAPAEPRSHGFNHLADAQSMSHFQLQSHLEIVDTALEAAFTRVAQPDANWAIDFPPEKIARKKPRQRNRDPEMRKGAAVVWSSNLVFYGRITNSRIPHSGWYDITVEASAVKKPDDKNVWCSVRSGECVSSAPLMSWIGSFEATDQPQTHRYRAYIPEGHLIEIRPADTTLKKGRGAGGQIGFGELEPQNVPGVAMHRLTVTQVYPAGEIEDVRSRLFGDDVPMRWSKELKQSIPNLGELTEEERRAWLADRIAAFASLAYRRPVDLSEIDSIIEMAQWSLDEDQHLTNDQLIAATVDALRLGYRAVLCSPRFVYFVEPADRQGRLDDYAIANRLSYMLTGTMPDEQLRRAADAGKLNQPWQIKKHVDRLLQTKNGRRFVPDFTGQWLDLVDIDFTEPDRRLFRDFDLIVQQSMLEETHHFVQKQLDENRPISELIGADYTFLNERLARYYGIDDVDGQTMQLVSLKPDTPRGGLLAQGSILKVTANGNDTSPVLRGIWVSERLLGVHVPAPPANVPAVEPDIRGATTIRELLAKHQSDPNCASCHRSIDPPGFALENFDAGAKWRDRYLQRVKRSYKRAASVDSSGKMPDGDAFETFFEFREQIAQRADTLAKNLAEKLLTYGTGAEATFSDRDAIENMVARAQEHDFGFRSILHEVVTSEPFLHK
ncbi:MAG: DUF1592 domain-containing protein [Planctomycetota bacterium]